MAKIVDLVVPNIGDFKNVEIIEILISENQSIKKMMESLLWRVTNQVLKFPLSFQVKLKPSKLKLEIKFLTLF